MSLLEIFRLKMLHPKLVELRFGTISTRKIDKKANKSKNKTYLKNLYGESFFNKYYIIFPKTITSSFKPLYDRIEWINNEGDFKNGVMEKLGIHL